MIRRPVPGSRVEWIERSGRGRTAVERSRVGTVWAEGPKALSIWAIPDDGGPVVLLTIRQSKETMRWTAKRDDRYRPPEARAVRPVARPAPHVDGQVSLFGEIT